MHELAGIAYRAKLTDESRATDWVAWGQHQSLTNDVERAGKAFTGIVGKRLLYRDSSVA